MMKIYNTQSKTSTISQKANSIRTIENFSEATHTISGFHEKK